MNKDIINLRVYSENWLQRRDDMRLDRVEEQGE